MTLLQQRGYDIDMSESGFLPVPDMNLPPPTDGASAVPSRPFDDATLEEAYQFDRQMLLTPAPAAGKGLFLIATLALFVLTQAGSGRTLVDVAALVGVLLFHELGHFAGMKLFGYRDVKMFFIPLFGAAVSGKRRGVAAWKEAIVLLLGPVPGLIAALFILRSQFIHPSPPMRALAVSLITINAFNLLPIAPLDGGQFFRLLLFSRHRLLEVAFAAAAAVLLILLGIGSTSFVLPVIGLMMLLGLPRLWRLLREVRLLKAEHGLLAADPAALDDVRTRALFLAARRVTLNTVRRRPRDGAVAMEQVLERASSQPPGILSSLALFLGWVAGVAVVFVGVAWLSLTSAPNWTEQQFAEGGFSIKMPHKSAVHAIERDTPLGKTAMRSLDAVGTGGMFDARFYDIPSARMPAGPDEIARFLDQSRDLILARGEARLLDERPIPNGIGRAFRMDGKTYGVEQVRIVLRGSRVIMLRAPAEPDAEATMFFESFKPL